MKTHKAIEDAFKQLAEAREMEARANRVSQALDEVSQEWIDILRGDNRKEDD